MTSLPPNKDTDNSPLQAEFDQMAEAYYEKHKANIAITGESPEYFAEYKIADLAELVRKESIPSRQIFDFGSGIGNSLPFFRKYFGQSELQCGDVSAKSIEIAQTRFPGQEKYLLVGRKIPLPTHSQDIAFSACVFHHISHDKHRYWLRELHRIVRPGGLLVIYEHNPLNPLTVHAVNTCPLDINARLIPGKKMRFRAMESGWEKTVLEYRVFFPSILKGLRLAEKYLGWLPLGAQYRISARREDYSKSSNKSLSSFSERSTQ